MLHSEKYDTTIPTLDADAHLQTHTVNTSSFFTRMGVDKGKNKGNQENIPFEKV